MAAQLRAAAVAPHEGAGRGLKHLQRRVVQKKAELKLAGVREGIRELFALTRLDTVFPIYRDVASAIEAFGNR